MMPTVYNNLVTTYIPNPPTKYSSHQNSELKKIYNRIINISKQSPLYMLNLSRENQLFALGIKDASINLSDEISFIYDNSAQSIFKEQIAESSDTTVVEAEIVTSNYDLLPKEFQIKVLNLATNQVNTSKELPSNYIGPESGSYQFAINIRNNLYEFQFNVPENSTNKEIQTKLGDFINKANIGLHISVEDGSTPELSKIILESDLTGTKGDLIFTLEDCSSKSNNIGIIQYFQLNNVTSYPQNAQYKLNDELKESLTNSFTLNKALNISLNSSSSDSVSIKYVTNCNIILEKIEHIVHTYNNLISLANKHKEDHKRASKLISDIGTISSTYKNELEACGLNINDENHLVLDPTLALLSINDGDMQKLFTNSSSYSTKLINKTYDIMINPMDYLDKVVVSYKDLSKPCYPNPYLTSIYSGMLFNYYC